MDEDLELIDGLTFDEWLDMIPVGLEKMTEAQKQEALREVNIRVAEIREKRADDESWQTKVYGKKDGYYPPPTAPNYKDMKVSAPLKALYYSQKPTGTLEDDKAIMMSIARRDAGVKPYTAEECKARMRAAIERMKSARRT